MNTYDEILSAEKAAVQFEETMIDCMMLSTALSREECILRRKKSAEESRQRHTSNSQAENVP